MNKKKGGMNRKSRLLVLLIGFVVLAPHLLGADDITIQVRFFQGNWMEDQPGLNQVKILSTSSHPEIASLKAMVRGPENELKVALIDALLNVMNLRTVDDLFSFEKIWNGKDASLREPIIQKPSSVYRFKFRPEWISPQTVSLQTIIYYKDIEVFLKTGEDTDKELRRLSRWLLSRSFEKLMEKILDKELVLDIGDPVIVCIPYEGRAFFMMIALTKGSLSPEQEAPVEAKKPGKTYVLEAPKPIHQVVPIYPEELRQKGVEGEVEVQFMVDKEGAVQHVEVMKSLHPYLDYTAVQALRQWRFEPPLREGKPVPGIFTLKVHFKKDTWRGWEETTESQETPTDSESSSQEKLQKILERCAEYCRKLADSALDFICEETIKETRYGINTEAITEQKKELWSKSLGKKQTAVGPIYMSIGKWNIRLWDTWRTEKNQYVCDYQLVKKGGQIKEQRIILKENGRKTTDQKKLLEEKRFSMFRPLFAAVRLLERDRQPLFNYRLLKEQKLHGKKAYVIEVMPRFKDVGDVEYAKIWVDKKSFQVLKSEIEGVPIEGYEEILKETTLLNVKPEFKTTHHYQLEKKGVLFPGRSEVRVAYTLPLHMGGRHLRLKIDMNYDKFKFFTVETDHRIIKKNN